MVIVYLLLLLHQLGTNLAQVCQSIYLIFNIEYVLISSYLVGESTTFSTAQSNALNSLSDSTLVAIRRHLSPIRDNASNSFSMNGR